MKQEKVYLEKVTEYPTEKTPCPKCGKDLKYPDFSCSFCKIILVFFVKSLV